MGLDDTLLIWVNQGWGNPALDPLFAWVSDRWVFGLPLLGLLLADAVRRAGGRGLRLGLFLTLSIVVGDQIGNQLKSVFAEPRPCAVASERLRQPGGTERAGCGDNLTGMPSNHALNFTLATVLTARTTPWRSWHYVLVASTALVAASRVYLGKHYPSQVMGGVVLGLGLGLLASALACYYGLCLRRDTELKESPGDPVAAGTLESLTPTVSLVVPLYNEAENVTPLVEGVHAALAAVPWHWELVLVDDGSTDGTVAALERVRERFGPHVRVLQLQRNFGQTAAMQAGIDEATGTLVVTLDGDLQNDPADIPAMVRRLVEEDLDLLVGWRRKRQDNVWLRTIPSRIANGLIGRVTGVRLHDYGCSLKVYRTSVLRGLRLFGEMHRFIPAWLALETSPTRIREQVVNHRRRLRGVSKYGIDRAYRVMLDLLAVHFFLRFLARPGHFFGRFGLAFGLTGGAILGYLAVVKFLLGEDIGTRPLLSVGVLLVVVAVQFLTTGVLSELVARTYFAASGGRPYVVRRDSGGVGPSRPVPAQPDPRPGGGAGSPV